MAKIKTKLSKKTKGSSDWEIVDLPIAEDGTEVVEFLKNVGNKALNVWNSIFENPKKTDPKKAALETDSEKAALMTIRDPRKIRLTTNQKINPNRDLFSGSYPTEDLVNIVKQGKNKKLTLEDIYNLAAIDLQERQWGKIDNNPGHVLFGKGENPIDRFINAYINSQEKAKRLGYTDPHKKLQVYNGLGIVVPATEQDYHGFKMKSIYGVPIPKEGINMKKNPLYGKQITDLKENVLKKNPNFVSFVDSLYKLQEPEGKFVGFKDGGIMNNEWEIVNEELPEAGSGYKVVRSNERKGKTHKVIGPDGTVKFFGDSKLGQHPKDPARKKAFYARHAKNLKNNPYFRAFARKTWAEGGMLPDPMEMAFGGMYGDGGQYLTVDGEYHRVYRNADGDIMVNHPKEDKGKWDTINLTKESNANTIAEGVASVKKWHRENPYAFGGNIMLEKYDKGGKKGRKKREQTEPPYPLNSPYDMYGMPMLATPQIVEGVTRSFYDPRLNMINLGSDFTNFDKYQKDKLMAHENYHAYQFQNDHATYLPIKDVPYKKPSMVSTDDIWYSYYNRKPIEVETDIANFRKKNPTFNLVPEQLIYNNVVDYNQYFNPFSLEGSAKFYEDLGAISEFEPSYSNPIEYAQGGSVWEIID